MEIAALAKDVLLNSLYRKTISFMKEQAGLVLSLEDEVRFLRRILPKVNKLVVNAEEPENEERREFLASLREFAYDAEDILDDLDTEVGRTKQQQQQQQQQPQPLPQQTEHGRRARQLMDCVKWVMGDQWFKGLCIILKPVCRCFPVFSSFDSDDYDRLPLLFRTKVANQIKGLYAELGKVMKEKERVEGFANSVKGGLSGDGEVATDGTGCGSSSSSKRPQTDAMLRKDFRLVGRDGEKDRVIKGLLASRSNPPSVLLITGMGGIGKTTLAQDIFRDPAVDKHFEFRMWVCVGDMELVPKKVLDKISGKRTVDFEEAREKVQSAVKNKRFLIVLDDVWKGNKLQSSWDELWDPLSYGDWGSRVIITTRQGDIQDEIEVKDVEKEELYPLADEACLEIFETFAFRNVRGTPSPRLKEIGKRIVCKKIKGVPLAAKVIGSSLRRHQRVELWKAALHEINEKDISSALIWSYRCLPTHLKQCFSYCSLFPKDSCLDRTEIVHMWMAQCYVVQPKGGNISHLTLEDVGEEYFDDLVKASLIQVVGDDYKMHDLIHDLAMEVSRGVCFYKSEDGDKTENYEVKELQALHHLVLDRGVKLPQNHSDIKKLRTFKSYDPCHADILSNQLRTVRVLVVTKRFTAYEANFTNMMHLRYLDLSGLGIRTLPESLCNLYNLQVLALSNNVTEFPPGMCKLIHLRHLHGGDHISRITRIGELTSLQTISDFYSTIGEFLSFRNNGESLRELKNLNQLRGRLTICNLKSVQSSQFAHGAQLHDKVHLEELVLNMVDTDFDRCVDDVGETSSDTDEYMMLIREVFGGLRPHEGIKVLKIKNYPADELPTWMEGRTILNIVSLSLRSCDHLKKLPPLGHLHYLEFLKIKYSSSIKGIGCEIYGTGTEQEGCEGPKRLQVFFYLKELVLMGIPKLKEWEELVVSGDEGQIDYFPSLRRLYVKKCKNLRHLLHVPVSLEELYIDSTSLTVLPKVWGCSCDDAGDVSEHNCNPRCLTSLSLIDCPVSVVNHWLSHMPSLSTVILHRVNKCSHVAIASCDKLVKLEILDMDELQSLKLQNLGSLELFSLLECPSLLEIGLTNLPSLRKMEISDCRVTKISGLRDLRALRRMSIGFYDAITIDVGDEYALKNLDSLEVYYTWGILKAVDPKSLVMLELSNFNFGRDMSSDDQEWLSQWWQNLESIERIIIFGASGRSFPPFMRLQNLHSLKRIEIHYCNKLQVLPELPPHFGRERLIIEECPFLQDFATIVQVLSS